MSWFFIVRNGKGARKMSWGKDTMRPVDTKEIWSWVQILCQDALNMQEHLLFRLTQKLGEETGGKLKVSNEA